MSHYENRAIPFLQVGILIMWLIGCLYANSLTNSYYWYKYCFGYALMVIVSLTSLFSIIIIENMYREIKKLESQQIR